MIKMLFLFYEVLSLKLVSLFFLIYIFLNLKKYLVKILSNQSSFDRLNFDPIKRNPKTIRPRHVVRIAPPVIHL